MKRAFAAAAVAFLTLVASTAFAIPPLEKPIRGVLGRAVQARVIHVSDLPRAVPNEQAVVREIREGADPAEAEVEALKRNPRPPGFAGLTHVTLDSGRADFQPLAPTAGIGFEGIKQNGYVPGEPTVAVGPLNIFTMGNISVTFTNKDGTGRQEAPGQNFFGIPNGESPISDPQCYYDALRGRFVGLAFTTDQNTYCYFYLAVSQTNDCRGAWYIYKFDQMLDGTTPTSNWSDYEALGVSEDKIAMTSQQFHVNSYQYQKIRVISRAAAYSGGPVPYVDFVNFAAPPGGNLNDNFVTKAARNLSPGDSTIHCLNVRTGGGSHVTYREITGPPASPALSAGTLVSCATYSPPPDAAQLGSSNLIPTNDCRPGDFYVRNGVLIVSWHASANFGSGVVSAVRLFRLRTSDLTVLTDELYGADGIFYYFPAVTVDSVGTIFLGFDRSSASEYTSSWATGKRRSDATLEPSVRVKSGVNSYISTRWGDYTGIDNDATASGPGGSTAWYAGQWAKSTSAFGTWITQLTFTYGQIAGTVFDDCDGNAATSGDRTPLAGVTLTLMQGVTTLATTTTDAGGNYNFGYLESGTYDVVVTPPAGGANLDATAGSGGTTQTRVSASDLQVNLTNAQTSSTNQFLVTSTHAPPATSTIVPAAKNSGDAGFTLTVNGSNFVACAVVLVDGSPRTTTWVNASQLTAAIPASDLAAVGTHAITVSNPAPGGGTSNGQTLTVNGFALALTTVGGGTATPSPSLPSYAYGAPVTLTATPGAGWVFSGWSGDTATATNPLNLVIVANRAFTATFADTAAPRVHVVAAHGGETAPVGSVLDLQWSATDNGAIATIDLLLSRSGAGGPFDSLAAGLANTGSYSWTVTGPPTGDAFLEVVAHDTSGNAGYDFSDSAFTIGGTAGVASSRPTVLELGPVRPNPSHGATVVGFALPHDARVHVTVHDVLGREVAVLADGAYAAGRYQLSWNGARELKAGLYFVRMTAAGRTLIHRVALIR